MKRVQPSLNTDSIQPARGQKGLKLKNIFKRVSLLLKIHDPNRYLVRLG